MLAFPTSLPFDSEGKPSKAWIDWANEVSKQTKYLGAYTTASRPTNKLLEGDWILDTTLGKPIWYYSSGWIDATGASV